MIKTIYLLAFFLLTWLSFVSAQERDSLNKIIAEYKKCSQQPVNQYGCSLTYLNGIDKLLDVIYRNLCDRLDTAGCNALKKEQVAWFNKRGVYYQNLDGVMDKKSKTVGAGMNDAVENANKKAAFEKDRLEVLLSRLDYLRK
jgi:uncharacterized protein YecT (DUF1311 family)